MIRMTATVKGIGPGAAAMAASTPARSPASRARPAATMTGRKYQRARSGMASARRSAACAWPVHRGDAGHDRHLLADFLVVPYRLPITAVPHEDVGPDRRRGHEQAGLRRDGLGLVEERIDRFAGEAQDAGPHAQQVPELVQPKLTGPGDGRVNHL